MRNHCPWYVPERDGTLEKYLEEYDGHAAFPVFRGYDQYEMLWNAGYFLEDYSVIRIMWNVGREDEHFLVRGEYLIEGISAPAHAGRKGTYDPRQLLEEIKCCWEAHHLSHAPQQRK